MRTYSCALLTLLLVLSTTSCGDEENGNGGGGNTGPSNQIDAEVAGGEAAGAIQGESETSQPNMYYGQVAGGELIVYLASSDSSVIFFRIDTTTAELPGSAPVTRTLDDTAYLTYTSGTTAQIYEGNQGTIVVDLCPNVMGTIVTGRFDGIGLTNTMTESAGGTLSGTWKVAIAASDMSANCGSTVADPGPDAGSDPTSDATGPSPGPSCPNPVCDGPCCPYLPALQSCYFACGTSADCDPMTGNPMNCMACYAGCPDESGMTDDTECMSAVNALGSCMETHSCESDDITNENACIEVYCCSEYQAVF